MSRAAVVALLLALGAVGALLRAASASPNGRLGGTAMVIVLGLVIAGAVRGRAWAVGAAFFVGLFTLWAAVALGLQGFLSSPWTAFGVVWAVALMVASVRGVRS